jgi:hypothetical protein
MATTSSLISFVSILPIQRRILPFKHPENTVVVGSNSNESLDVFGSSKGLT